jgi:hypothetical protein
MSHAKASNRPIQLAPFALPSPFSQQHTMRRPLKLVVTFVAILAVLIFIRLKLWVVWDQNSVLQYLRSAVDNGLDDINFVDNPPTDKIIVMAKTAGADTDWVEDYLPE